MDVRIALISMIHAWDLVASLDQMTLECPGSPCNPGSSAQLSHGGLRCPGCEAGTRAGWCNGRDLEEA